jgi:hypothetical protein
VLDARIVDQDIDAAELDDRFLDETGSLLGLHQVRAIVDDAADRADPVELLADEIDLALLGEAVDDDVRAGFREGAGDSEADAAGRSGDNRDLARKRAAHVRHILDLHVHLQALHFD